MCRDRVTYLVEPAELLLVHGYKTKYLADFYDDGAQSEAAAIQF